MNSLPVARDNRFKRAKRNPMFNTYEVVVMSHAGMLGQQQVQSESHEGAREIAGFGTGLNMHARPFRVVPLQNGKQAWTYSTAKPGVTVTISGKVYEAKNNPDSDDDGLSELERAVARYRKEREVAEAERMAKLQREFAARAAERQVRPARDALEKAQREAFAAQMEYYAVRRKVDANSDLEVPYSLSQELRQARKAFQSAEKVLAAAKIAAAEERKVANARENPKDDDTVSKSRQAEEDTFMAMVEAGALRGMFSRAPNTVAELNKLYSDMRSLTARDIVIYRVPRELTSGGRASGAAFALFIAGSPNNVRGRGQLSFDGWADDPRELFQVPQVVEFCKGMLLGPHPAQGDISYGRKALPFLVHEVDLAQAQGTAAFRNIGQGWLAACAFPNAIYSRSAGARSGWLRDVGQQEDVVDWIMGRGPKPRFA